jgi:hypothetical protein
MCANGVQHIVGKLLRRDTSCFRHHSNRKSEQGVMNSQNLGSPNRDSFETSKKCHLDVGATGKRKEYNIGEGGGFP